MTKQPCTLIILYLLLPTVALGKPVIVCSLKKPAAICRPDPLCSCPTLYDQYPWSVMYYYGRTVKTSLMDIFKLHHLHYTVDYEYIQSLELAYTLNQTNILRRFFRPIVDVIQAAGNMVIRNGTNQPTIYEIDPYIIFRWTNFLWNNYINTSLALAEGVSYTTSIPANEVCNATVAKRLLNYLMFEITLASPNYPRLQLIARIHHRSAAFGLYNDKRDGSNNVGFGIRYLFD